MAGSTASEAAVRQWLDDAGEHFQLAVMGVSALAVLVFAIQAGSAWVLSGVLASAVQGQPMAHQDLMVLAALFGAQLIMMGQKIRQKQRLGASVLQHFQAQLDGLLQQQGLAAIRDHSPAAWQSFYLQRIPALQHYYMDYLPQRRLAVLAPVLVLLIVAPLSWLVALLLLLSAPLIPLFMWIVGMGAAAVHRKHFLALERLGGIFLDRLNARQLLHIYRQTGNETRFFATAARELKKRTLAVVSLAFLSASVLDFFSTIAMALVAVFIGFTLLGELAFGTWGKDLTLATGLFLLLLIPLFFSELKTLGKYYHARAEAFGAGDALMSVLEGQSRQRAIRRLPLPLRLGAFTLNQEDNRVLVSGKQLTLNPGDHVLLQGPSGSGKTSLLEALLGWRQLVMHQQPVALDVSQVAWLAQVPVILPGTVRDNLTLGQPFDDGELLRVLQQVELTQWLEELPAGLATAMGDYPPLSGGQRQRLAIARLLLFDQPILFLDEPLAGLSPDQQARIRTLLQKLLMDKTVIWIAHDMTDSGFFDRLWQIDSQGVLHCQHKGRVLMS